MVDTLAEKLLEMWSCFRACSIIFAGRWVANVRLLVALWPCVPKGGNREHFDLHIPILSGY